MFETLPEQAAPAGHVPGPGVVHVASLGVGHVVGLVAGPVASLSIGHVVGVVGFMLLVMSASCCW